MAETAVSTAIDVFDSGTQSELTISFGMNPRVARWEQVIDQLLRFRSLAADWDGQGAVAPDLLCLNAATRWVYCMSQIDEAVPPTRVVPGVGGEVSLVWQRNADYLEAEVSCPEEIEWTIKLGHRQPSHFESEIDGYVVGG